MAYDEVIHSRVAWAEQIGDKAVKQFEANLTLALEPLLTDFPDEVRGSLLGDAFGIVLWLHTKDIQILLDDAPALKAAEGSLSDILDPLRDLMTCLRHLSPLAREAINSAAKRSFLNQVFLGVRNGRYVEGSIELGLTGTKRSRLQWPWNLVIYVCILGTRVIRNAVSQLHEQLSEPAEIIGSYRLKQVQAYEDLLNIQAVMHRLVFAVGDKRPLNRLRFSHALIDSRPSHIFLQVTQSNNGSGNRDYCDIANLLLRSSEAWCNRLRYGVAVRLGKILKLDAKAHLNKPTLDHIREAIFYLTQAWTNRTGEPATRKWLNNETMKNLRAKGLITTEDANTKYERFINAALDTIRPLNKTTYTDSMKPYDAQIAEILAGSYQPRPVTLDDA